MASLSVYAAAASPARSSWSVVAGYIPSYWSGVETLFAVGFAMGAGIVLYRVVLVWFRRFVQ